MSGVDKRVVQSRTRNRIIEYLELASSFAAQLEYQAKAPMVHVAHEVINQWQDWVGEDPGTIDWLPDIFSAEELRALWTFHRVWEDVANGTPDPLPELAQTQSLPPWKELRDAARACIAVLMRRGKMAED